MVSFQINQKIAYLSSGEFGSLILPGLKKTSKDLIIITVASENKTKKIARRLNLKTYEVKSKNDLEELIGKNKINFLIVADFGIILSEKSLKKAKKVINIHPSILPKYRGPSPIISAILNREKETGVSLIEMIKEIDAGPVYMQKTINIKPADNQITLTKKLAELSIKMVEDNLLKILNNQIDAKKQNHPEATFTKMIKKTDGLINWHDNALGIEAKVKALASWPQAYTYFLINSKKIRIKILEVKIIDNSQKIKIGQTIEKKNFLAIQTKDKLVSIEKLQKEGKKEMNIKEFLAGHKNIKINPL